MSAVAEARSTAKRQLDGVRSAISDLRDERATLAKRRNDFGAQATDDKGNFDMNSPYFSKAEKAAKDLREVEDKLAVRQAEETRLLGLMGEDVSGPGANGPSSAEPGTEALTGRDGAWLSSVLRRRAADIPQLGDDLKARAASGQYEAMGHFGAEAPSSLSLEQYSSTAESQAVIDLLAPQSVAMASGFQKIDMTTTKVQLPRFTELPKAEWVPESGKFPLSAPGLELVDVEPGKCGLVTPISIEVFADLSPQALAMVQTNVVRAVALSFDEGLLFGAGDAETGEPLGIAKTPKILAQEGDVKSLAVFRKALAALLAANARPQALVINPVDFGSLLDIVEFEGETESNVPLLQGDSIEQGFTVRAVPGVRWFLTSAAPKGTAVMYDPSILAAVIREAAEISVDPFYKFDEGEVGLRVFVRGDALVGQTDGVCVIDLGTAEEGS